MSNTTTNKYKRLLKNIGMLLAGNFVTKILSFFMVPFYTSILSTADYGTADLISNTVLLVLPLFSLLMDEAVMRFTLDQTTDRKQVFTIALTISTAGYLIAMCFSPIILLFDTLKSYYWFVVMYYIVSWIYNLVSNYVKGMDRLSLTTTAGIIHTFSYLGLNVFFLAVLQIGIYGYLLAINLSNLIAIFFLVIVCKIYKNIISIKRIDWELAKQMVRYSLPMIPNYMLWWVNNASDKYILSMFFGAAANGVYSIAYKIPNLLNSVTSIFFSAWKISSVDNFGSNESIRFYDRVYAFYSALLMIVASGLIFFTKLLATILYAKDFFIAWTITPILIFAYVFSSLAQQISSIFSASKQTKRIFYASMVGAIVNIILNFILIPLYKGHGAAIATAIGYITIWTINMINSRDIIKMNFNLIRIIPAGCILVIEIVAILSDSLMGYIVSAICVMLIMLINYREFINIIKIIKMKALHQK